ncbi:MAG TPA: GntR family transcriptional regulator [Xanthobacteraceae bacterium]|jgi:DNA-binding GntR family transcriptional regulator|nr:GntR family transcriptional regulator [Xanthobacteraceae bacterium]
MSDDTVRAALMPLKLEAAPLRRKILTALRRAIETGELKPGDRLVEKDLCQELNVSRTSLREALRELQAEKLVVAVPRGLIVAEISDEDAANIYQVRAALEGLVAAQFAETANALDVEKLKTALDRLEDAYRLKDFEKILDAKKGFYDAICHGARNAVVRDLLDHLGNRINQLRSTSREDDKRWMASLAELKKLAGALLARNPKAARAAAIKHVDAAARTVLRKRDGKGSASRDAATGGNKARTSGAG